MSGVSKKTTMMELITLKIFNTWDPVEDKNFWEAIIEIPIDYSLFDFHLYIQNQIAGGNDIASRQQGYADRFSLVMRAGILSTRLEA